MSQIDHEMEQIGRRRGSVAPFSSVAMLAAPLHGALTARPLREPWLASARRALDAALQHAVDAIWTWRERMRTRRQLAMLDDRLLRDIGITRLQARSEAEKPFWRV
jgi:uncharacterized protein YjiS (DUF1127 family)